jgi:exosome complex exonuclease RRP6
MYDLILIIQPAEITFLHPYDLEIINYQAPSFIFESTAEIMFGNLNMDDVNWVATLEDLNTLCEKLSVCSEFAVDLEHHDFRTFQGICCLIQISTRTENFIVYKTLILD